MRYGAFGLGRSHSTNRQRPFTFRIAASCPTKRAPGFTIAFTITVPFGYAFPTFGLLV